MRAEDLQLVAYEALVPADEAQTLAVHEAQRLFESGE